MTNYSLILIFAVLILGSASRAEQVKGSPFESGGSVEILGEPQAGLQSFVLCDRQDNKDWQISVRFIPLTNFPRHSWLLTSNDFQCKLWLSSTNGLELKPTDKRVKEAAELPVFTTVSNALSGIKWERRGGQWPYGKAGQEFQTAGFPLRWAFNIPLTNDVLLQIIPFMYKENTNSQTAWLEEFRPIRVKLKTNGSVEKAE